MANVLGELFQDIANAIRSKTGATGSMKPMQFPDAIAGISVGSGGDEIDDVLDEINGEVIGETLYHVTFIGATGEELVRVPVYERDDCPDPVESGDIDRPTKESTKYYSYPFTGWALSDGGEADDSALLNITGNKTVYAAFKATKIYLASGDCSPSTMVWMSSTWTLDPDYTLQITGNGMVGNYYNGSGDGAVPPWNTYKDRIQKVVFGEGMTGTGMYCFKGCTALTTVVFSTAFQDIVESSFQGCTALESINLPATLESIKNSAFADCTSLTNVVFARTSGWRVQLGQSGSITLISANDLTSPITAAQYLTETYRGYNWENTEV